MYHQGSRLLASLAAFTTLFQAGSTQEASSESVLSLKFQKTRVPKLSNLARRQSSTVNVGITNEQLLYLINVTIGTPPQPLSLQLDTGSTDLWVPSSSSNLCSRSRGYCELGSFNAQRSSTYQGLSTLSTFEIEYVDGSEVAGVYFQDTLDFGGISLSNPTMADCNQLSRDIGIFGVSFAAAESSNHGGIGSFTYPSVLEVMKSQGKIQSLSYSLWLDDLAADTGTILFGGVDTSKYTGNLVSLPIQTDAMSGGKTTFTVAWTGLTISGEGQTVNLNPGTPQPAILDSGTTITYLPNDIANSIFSAFGVTTDPNYGQILPCRVQANNFVFTYTFGGNGGPSIAVPLSELTIPLTTESGAPFTGTGTEPLCQFGIDAANGNPILLGDTFLRSAYVVYDLENLEIGLAQTNFNAQPNAGSNVQQIVNSADIPGVASTASSAVVEQTFTGKPLNTNGASGNVNAAQTVSRSATLQLQATGTAPATMITSVVSSSSAASITAPSSRASTRSSSAAASSSSSASPTMTAASASASSSAAAASISTTSSGPGMSTPSPSSSPLSSPSPIPSSTTSEVSISNPLPSTSTPIPTPTPTSTVSSLTGAAPTSSSVSSLTTESSGPAISMSTSSMSTSALTSMVTATSPAMSQTSSPLPTSMSTSTSVPALTPTSASASASPSATRNLAGSSANLDPLGLFAYLVVALLGVLGTW